MLLRPAATCRSDSSEPVARKGVSLVERMDNLFVYHGYAETLLLVINFLLVLKTSVNLLAVYNDSKSLITDYNGLMLFDSQFRLCFISMNLALFFTSSLCLVTLLLVSPSASPSSAKLRLKLTKYYALAQLLLAVITLLLMGKLWFSPPRLGLDADDSISNEIITYTYHFGPDSSGAHPSWREPTQINSNRFIGNSMMVEYKYTSAFDRLQQALGCCGIWSSEDWRRLNERAGLVAPSCCLKPRGPMRLLVPADKRFQSVLVGSANFGGPSSASESESMNQGSMEPANNMTTSADLDMFYCIEPTNDIGCQRLISENELTFVFRLRILLLLLLALLFINIITLASIDRPTSRVASMHFSSEAGSRDQEVQPPPYEAALGPPRYAHSSSVAKTLESENNKQVKDETALMPSQRDICLVRAIQGLSSSDSSPVLVDRRRLTVGGSRAQADLPSCSDNDDQGQRPRAVLSRRHAPDNCCEPAINCIDIAAARNNTVITML